MLVLSRKLNQEVVFPTIGVTIEVTRIRGSTICLGIDAPKDIPILRGELESTAFAPDSKGDTGPGSNHEIRNRLNALSLCLQLIKESQESALPIAPHVLSRALYELHTIEEIIACPSTPNPFVKDPKQKHQSPFVMLVDDAVNEAELLASYLRHVGIQVAVSNDGRGALNLLECFTRQPDVILLDMIMPELDGKGMLSVLRNNPAYDSIKVFAVSGLPAESLSKNDGPTVDRWFQKPIQPPELVQSIRGELAIPA